jgi:hypothetical protein
LFQQTLGRAELVVGHPLRFMAFAVAPDIYAQSLSGGFNVPHGGSAMAFVIVIGAGQRAVSLGQERA